MPRKKKVEVTEFSGDLSLAMLAVWGKASLPESYETRQKLATLQFYYKTKLGDGLLVLGTQALVVSQQVAEEYLNHNEIMEDTANGTD